MTYRSVFAWSLVGVALAAGVLPVTAWEPPASPPAESGEPPAPAEPADRPETLTPDPAQGDKGDEDEAKDNQLEQSRKRLEQDAEYYELFKIFADTMDQVERNYVKDVSRRELMEAAIRGVLEQLDPYSNYISPDELSRFRTSVESQFGGIGIQVDMRDGRLLVVSPLVGSPAYRAGLQAGDTIVEIEGQSTEGIDLDEAIRRLKGEAGTSVTITVFHPQRGAGSTGSRKTVTIQREIIRVDTVMGDQRNEQDRWDFALDRAKGIGYVRVSAFSRETRRELQKALEELQSQKLRGLILDLRGNPGGLLTSAIEIADLFLEEGVIVSTSGRNSAKRSWDARKPGTFTGFPMAVLVNRYSASASEIVSAALQDHKRAVVIGERTWGKGSVQNVIELENGKSALKLTTASYQRPNGHNIHRFPDAKETDEWGVVPDPGFEVKLEDEELIALLRYRRDRDVLLINHSVPADERNGLSKDEGGSQSDESSKAKEPQPGAKSDAGDGREQPGGAESNNDGGKPAGKPAGEDAAQRESPENPPSKPFVDRQLQKAIDYLTTELAKAN